MRRRDPPDRDLQKATPVTDYTIQIELDESSYAGLRHELMQRLRDYLPSVTDDRSPLVVLRFVVSSADMWSAVLTSMVALTDVGCKPASLHIRAADRTSR